MEIAYRYHSSDQGTDPFLGSDERLGRWAAGLWTNNELSDDEAREQVDLEMAAMTAGAEDIWVMFSESESWDKRQLMGQWLNENGTLIDTASYHGVQVQRYHLP